ATFWASALIFRISRRRNRPQKNEAPTLPIRKFRSGKRTAGKGEILQSRRIQEKERRRNGRQPFLWNFAAGGKTRGAERQPDRRRRHRRLGTFDANFASDRVARIRRIRRANHGSAALVPGGGRHRRSAGRKRGNPHDAGA